MSGDSGKGRASTAGSALLWGAGWAARFVLLVLIRGYRATLGQVIGANCRFYPSCSAYAEQAIREQGAARGSALAAWRLLRCSPLSAGGVDHPPAHSRGGGSPASVGHEGRGKIQGAAR